jgi:hypothetical protein
MEVLEALLVRATVPLTEPLAVGAKFTWKVALCPAVSVMGSVRPLMLKPAPDVLALEIVTLAVLAVMVTFCEVLVPFVTEPKLSEVGFEASVPVAVAPVPVSEMLVEGLEALLVRATVPLTEPLAVGANFTWKVTLCPAARVVGRVKPLML